MLRTYLYIPDELNKKIVFAAKVQKKSKADVMRRALQQGIAAVNKQSNAGLQVLFKIAQIGKKYHVTGPKDAVEHFDDYLYGKDWSKDE